MAFSYQPAESCSAAEHFLVERAAKHL